MPEEWLEFVKIHQQQVEITLKECEKHGKYHRTKLSNDHLVEISPSEMQYLLEMMEKSLKIVKEMP